MRTIANLNGVEFLKAINRTRHAVGKFMTNTNVMAIWKRKPVFTGKETEAEQLEMHREQVKQNLSDILDSLLETHAEETYDLIMALCVLDEGEPEPDGIALMIAALSLISDNRVIDFFMQLARSGLFVTAH